MGAGTGKGMSARSRERYEARLARFRTRTLPYRILAARPRLMLACGVGLAAGAGACAAFGPIVGALVGWDSAVAVYIALMLAMMAHAGKIDIAFRSKLADDGAPIILALTCAASVASVVATLFELSPIKTEQGLARYGALALVGSTIVLSWAFIHFEFAVHYAHAFYSETVEGEIDPAPTGPYQGGLTFPGCETPLYSDFLYFSFIVGVASQTADVSISSRRMRKISLVHSILCFFFNTTILALTINIAASLL